ncbi:MAG TPA: DUF1456 family protein [Cycloclasticus sp.]|jgi:uncharacterized protein YehS (DUF1456 family)|nr:DUF1456 family protein [Cycloclasticus sp.]HIL92400.1 DUF1456 family protein [Cycloclasticus sp.]
MTNNDILRRIRYTFDFNDSTMIQIFELVEIEVTREQISNWLKKDDDETYSSCSDVNFATFLNGLIIKNRGRQDGPLPIAETKLTNNIVLRKLKIALDLKNDDVLSLLASAGLALGKHELSAFFRRADHKHYRPCKDQVLRNFLQGIQAKNRPTAD